MRGIRIASAALTLFAACTIKAADGTSSGGTDAGGTACDNKNDCSACVNCAEQVACAKELNACDQNSVCVGIIQCMSICSDPTCKQDCLNNNPAGVADYDALATCDYCQECPHDCAGFRQCM